MGEAGATPDRAGPAGAGDPDCDGGGDPQAAGSGRNPRRPGLHVVLLAGGILLLALNLRPAITGVPPIFHELRRQLDLSATSLTLLATVPLLCFALFSPVAARLGHRFGEERVLAAALAGLALALLLRGAAPSTLLFPATAAAATAITALNVLVPSLVKRRQPRYAGLFLGEYLLALYLGGTLGSLVAVPLYQGSGHSLLVTLAGWSLLAVLAFVCWLPQLRNQARRAGAARGPRLRAGNVYRSMIAWQVAFYFGLQSMGYYACISWLPSFFRDRGASAAHAGLLASMLGIGGIATALLTPILAQRVDDHRALAIPIVLASAAGLAGAVFAPMSTQILWTGLLGLGQGASLGLATYFSVARTGSPAGAASLSAMSQSIGYVFAAAGPLVVGLLHAATGSWSLAMGLLFGVFGLQLYAGLLAGRPLAVDG